MVIFVHIGYPKTGSTAIQTHLDTNRNWFKRHGYYIPNSGYRPGQGHSRLLSIGDTSTPTNELAAYLDETRSIDELMEEIEACRKENFTRVLLSWEGFVHFDNNLISVLKDRFDPYEVKILAYVREQTELYESTILQAVKTRKGSRKTVFSLGETTTRRPAFMDFHSVLCRWVDIFGDKIEIKTRIYDRGLLFQGDVVTDFIDWLGLAIDGKFSRQEKNLNPSLDFNAAAILALADALGLQERQMSRLSHALARASAKNPHSQKHFLTAEELQSMRSDFAASNRLFFKRFTPENMSLNSPTGFEQHIENELDPTNSIANLIKDTCAALTDHKVQVWNGAGLYGHELSQVASGDGSEWRPTEDTGVWSTGDVSSVSFLLPRVNQEDGNVGIRLQITGLYFGDNESTTVCLGDTKSRTNLTSAQLCFPIDDNLLREGVHLKLVHDQPVSPHDLGTGNSPAKLAFKLTSISYEFYWSGTLLNPKSGIA